MVRFNLKYLTFFLETIQAIKPCLKTIQISRIVVLAFHSIFEKPHLLRCVGHATE